MRNYPEQTEEEKCPPFETISMSRHAYRRHHYVLQGPLNVSELLLTHPEPFEHCPRAQSVTAVSGAALKPKKQRDRDQARSCRSLHRLTGTAASRGARQSPDPRGSSGALRTRRARQSPPRGRAAARLDPDPHRAKTRGSSHSPQGRAGGGGRAGMEGRKEGRKEEEREEAAGGPGQPGQLRAPAGPGAAAVM